MIFHSPLSTNECREKLQAVTDESYWYGSHSVVGTIQQNKFQLRKRHSYPYFSVLPVFVFHGTLRKDTMGAIIEGHFSLNLYMKLFWAFWIIVIIPSSYAQADHIIFASFTLFMVGAIGIALFQGSRDKKYLQRFIERTLSARVN